MKRVVSVLMLGAILLSSTVWAEDTLDSVAKQLMEKWTKIQTISTPFSTAIAFKSPRNDYVMRLNGGGAFLFRNKDGVGQFRVDVNAKMPEPSTAQGKATAVCTGSDLFVDYEFLVFKKAEHVDLKTVPEIPGGKFPPVFYGDLMTQFMKYFNVTLLPAGPEAPNTWVFEGVAKEPVKEVPLQAVRAYFSKDTGILSRIVVLSTLGQELLNLTATDAIINKPIGDEAFVYVPPVVEAPKTETKPAEEAKPVEKSPEIKKSTKK